MSKKLFTPVNYDEALPTLNPTSTTKGVEEPMTAARAVEAINAELQKIQLGTSKMTAHAVQMREGSTPFLHALKTFSIDPTVNTGFALVEIAKQDFSATFSRYVETLMSSIFKGNK